MESRPSDETPISENEAELRPTLKSHTELKLTEHGKLPALSLASSLTDTE